MKNNLGTRIQQLFLTAQSDRTVDKREIEKVFQKLRLALMEAERKCRRLKMGRIEFTPEHNQILNASAYWQMAIKRAYPDSELATLSTEHKINREALRHHQRGGLINRDM